MKIHNFLPEFTDCVKRWKKVPSLKEFLEQYYNHLAPLTDMIFDGPELYEVLTELNWDRYRSGVLDLNPDKEYQRVLAHLKSVEQLFGQTLHGEIVLFGSFETIDGYARFEKGSHRYFDDPRTHSRGARVSARSLAGVWTKSKNDPRRVH